MALPKSPEATPVAAPTLTTVSAPAPAAPTVRRLAAAKPADVTCLAKAVYYEARGESADGQAAVAQVVLNRTHRPSYPSNVCGVVFQGVNQGGCQFSFACNGAMRRPLEPAAWTRARQVAADALGGHVMRAVGQAISFHVAALGSEGRGQIARIGSHVFFMPGKARGASTYRVTRILRLAGPGPEALSPATTTVARDAVATVPAVIAANSETAPLAQIQ
jgi:spore germination cell wall hydrolase CwlJ-like protein